MKYLAYFFAGALLLIGCLRGAQSGTASNTLGYFGSGNPSVEITLPIVSQGDGRTVSMGMYPGSWRRVDGEEPPDGEGTLPNGKWRFVQEGGLTKYEFSCTNESFEFVSYYPTGAREAVETGVLVMKDGNWRKENRTLVEYELDGTVLEQFDPKTNPRAFQQQLSAGRYLFQKNGIEMSYVFETMRGTGGFFRYRAFVFPKRNPGELVGYAQVKGVLDWQTLKVDKLEHLDDGGYELKVVEIPDEEKIEVVLLSKDDPAVRGKFPSMYFPVGKTQEEARRSLAEKIADNIGSLELRPEIVQACNAFIEALNRRDESALRAIMWGGDGFMETDQAVESLLRPVYAGAPAVIWVAFFYALNIDSSERDTYVLRYAVSSNEFSSGGIIGTGSRFEKEVVLKKIKGQWRFLVEKTPRSKGRTTQGGVTTVSKP